MILFSKKTNLFFTIFHEISQMSGCVCIEAFDVVTAPASHGLGMAGTFYFFKNWGEDGGWQVVGFGLGSGSQTGVRG